MIHNITHRGASAYEPENTLRAFERAIEMGATMLELDVHLSRADQAVVGAFYPWLPQRVKCLAPAIRTSVLIGQENQQADFVEWALAVEADYVHLCWENASPTPHRLLTPAMLAGIRQHGLGIILWHEERLSELRHQVKFDLDAICTDTPDVLSAILRPEDVNTHPAARPGLPNPGRNRRI